MDKEVGPAVLAFVDEKRLMADRRTPVDVIARMGVADARKKALDQAWLATGDKVIMPIWGELVTVSADGHWFCHESLDTHHRVGGDGEERPAAHVQRAVERVRLLKRTLDAGQAFRAVLQTNRVAIGNRETDKAANISTRVADDEEWHVAHWDADRKSALLVRGSARGWLPTEDDAQAARTRAGAIAVEPTAAASPGDVHAAALDYLTRHFAGYGYPTQRVESQSVGYDIEVADKKGNTLLQLAVKGATPGMPDLTPLTGEERAAASRGGTWRLVVVTDAIGKAQQHKLYKAEEIDQVPGLDQR